MKKERLSRSWQKVSGMKLYKIGDPSKKVSMCFSEHKREAVEAFQDAMHRVKCSQIIRKKPHLNGER